MNNEKLIAMLNHEHTFKQAVELIKSAPDVKKEFLKMRPGANPGLRNLFLALAEDPKMDPETLDVLGKRDLPNKIRFAVIANPRTKRETIETMVSQTNNDAVQDRAKEILQAKDDITKSKFNISIKEMKEIIREELKKVLFKRF